MSETKQETKPKGEWAKREKGAFWRRQSKDGQQTYLSGHITIQDEFGMEQRVKVVMFSNKDKSDPKSERYNEKAPDYKMYLSKDPDEASSSNSQPSESKAEAVEAVEAVENEEVL